MWGGTSDESARACAEHRHDHGRKASTTADTTYAHHLVPCSWSDKHIQQDIWVMGQWAHCPSRLRPKAHDARQPYNTIRILAPGESDMAGGPGVRSCHHLSDRNLAIRCDRAEIECMGKDKKPYRRRGLFLRRHSHLGQVNKDGDTSSHGISAS